MSHPEADHLSEAVMQALGAASVCWEPMDATGVFMDERATQIGRELLAIIQQWADGRECICKCHDPNVGVPDCPVINSAPVRLSAKIHGATDD